MTNHTLHRDDYRKYRFVTRARSGKWYDDLIEAQRYSSRIGAGFFDEASGRFFPYPGTQLEVLEAAE